MAKTKSQQSLFHLEARRDALKLLHRLAAEDKIKIEAMTPLCRALDNKHSLGNLTLLSPPTPSPTATPTATATPTNDPTSVFDDDGSASSNISNASCGISISEGDVLQVEVGTPDTQHSPTSITTTATATTEEQPSISDDDESSSSNGCGSSKNIFFTTSTSRFKCESSNSGRINGNKTRVGVSVNRINNGGSEDGISSSIHNESGSSQDSNGDGLGGKEQGRRGWNNRSNKNGTVNADGSINNGSINELISNCEVHNNNTNDSSISISDSESEREREREAKFLLTRPKGQEQLPKITHRTKTSNDCSDDDDGGDDDSDGDDDTSIIRRDSIRGGNTDTHRDCVACSTNLANKHFSKKQLSFSNVRIRCKTCVHLKKHVLDVTDHRLANNHRDCNECGLFLPWYENFSSKESLKGKNRMKCKACCKQMRDEERAELLKSKETTPTTAFTEKVTAFTDPKPRQRPQVRGLVVSKKTAAATSTPSLGPTRYGKEELLNSSTDLLASHRMCTLCGQHKPRLQFSKRQLVPKNRFTIRCVSCVSCVMEDARHLQSGQQYIASQVQQKQQMYYNQQQMQQQMYYNQQQMMQQRRQQQHYTPQHQNITTRTSVPPGYSYSPAQLGPQQHHPHHRHHYHRPTTTTNNNNYAQQYVPTSSSASSSVSSSSGIPTLSSSSMSSSSGSNSYTTHSNSNTIISNSNSNPYFQQLPPPPPPRGLAMIDHENDDGGWVDDESTMFDDDSSMWQELENMTMTRLPIAEKTEAVITAVATTTPTTITTTVPSGTATEAATTPSEEGGNGNEDTLLLVGSTLDFDWFELLGQQKEEEVSFEFNKLEGKSTSPRSTIHSSDDLFDASSLWMNNNPWLQKQQQQQQRTI